MIRLALCGPIAFEGDDLAVALQDCAREQLGASLQVEAFESPATLVDTLLEAGGDEQPCDIAVLRFDLPGINGIQVARELEEAGLVASGLRIVLCAADGSHAADASRGLASAYLVEPLSVADLERTVLPLVAEAEELHAHSVVLRCHEGVRRIPFSQITYVETTGRDQTIHRGEERVSVVRCSSRALFAHLEGDRRFYKLGSSYVLNLDWVEALSVRTGTVTLLDGTAIPVPVRLRTELADALCAHAPVCV